MRIERTPLLNWGSDFYVPSGPAEPLLDDSKPKHITYPLDASQQRPMSFRRRFYYTYTAFLVTLAVGLEIMLHESQIYNGMFSHNAPTHGSLLIVSIMR